MNSPTAAASGPSKKVGEEVAERVEQPTTTPGLLLDRLLCGRRRDLSLNLRLFGRNVGAARLDSHAVNDRSRLV